MKKQDVMLAKNFKSTFLSCEKDQEEIWKKLFITSKPYSDKLKRLLIVDAKDCLDMSQYQYTEMINKYDLHDLFEKKYIGNNGFIMLGEHQESHSFILLEFDNFMPSSNEQYRDCEVGFTILCNMDYWDLDDYKLRPWEIAGYVDGILSGARLSGIGTLHFISAAQIILPEDNGYGGVRLRYLATHMENSDDSETVVPEWPAAY